MITGIAFAGLIIWACVWMWRRFMPEPYPTTVSVCGHPAGEGCRDCREVIR